MIISPAAELSLKTNELSLRNAEMNDIMENISEGILTINQDFTINKEYSNFLKSTFNINDLAGRDFTDIIYSSSDVKGKQALSEYLNMLFENETASEGVLRELNPIETIEVGIGITGYHHCQAFGY